MIYSNELLVCFKVWENTKVIQEFWYIVYANNGAAFSNYGFSDFPRLGSATDAMKHPQVVFFEKRIVDSQIACSCHHITVTSLHYYYLIWPCFRVLIELKNDFIERLYLLNA